MPICLNTYFQYTMRENLVILHCPGKHSTCDGAWRDRTGIPVKYFVSGTIVRISPGRDRENTEISMTEMFIKHLCIFWYQMTHYRDCFFVDVQIFGESLWHELEIKKPTNNFKKWFFDQFIIFWMFWYSCSWNEIRNLKQDLQDWSSVQSMNAIIL